MPKITILNPSEATDNCPFPKHDWRLIDEGSHECAYCGAIGTDEDRIAGPVHTYVVTPGTDHITLGTTPAGDQFIVLIDGNWWGGYAFHFRAAAELIASRLTALQAYGLDALPSHISREDYETQCEILRLDCLTDDQCTSYAVRFGEFDVLYNNAHEIAKFGLARRRYNAIHAEEEAAKKARPRTKPDLIQANCGHQVERTQIMSTSTGTACPECYDRMSL